MRMFGYPAGPALNEHGLLALDEATLTATLPALARFLDTAADEMDELGVDYDHVHLQDRSEQWQEAWPDLIVVKPRNNSAGS